MEKPINHIISPERAKEIYEEYGQQRVPIIAQYENDQGNTEFEATRYGFCSFENLKKYVDYLSFIDSEMKQAGQAGLQNIRFYLAKYPNSDTFSDGEEIKVESIEGTDYSYKGKNTFFMLPTMMFGDAENGFVLSDDSNVEATPLAQYFMGNNTTEQKTTSDLNATNSLIFNEVGLRPPPPENDDVDF